MWFIFPQLLGLGHSAMAKHYGIGCLMRRAPTSPIRCSGRGWSSARTLLGIEGRSLHAIFGSPQSHLAVGQHREASLFLLGHSFVHGPVLDALAAWPGDLAGAKALLRGQQPRRPQQASDYVSVRRDHARPTSTGVQRPTLVRALRPDHVRQRLP
jgi:hypothetical protein